MLVRLHKVSMYPARSNKVGPTLVTLMTIRSGPRTASVMRTATFRLAMTSQLHTELGRVRASRIMNRTQHLTRVKSLMRALQH